MRKCSVMVRVRLADGEFGQHSKVVELNPLWVLVNRTARDLSVLEPAAAVNAPELALTTSNRAVISRSESRQSATGKPFTLKQGESTEVLSLPRLSSSRSSPAAFELRLAAGRGVPLVQQSLTLRVWEHERRVHFSSTAGGWSAQYLGETSMRTPLMGDPPHLVMDGTGVAIGGHPRDGSGLSVSQLLMRELSKVQGEEWEWVDTWDVEKDRSKGVDANGFMYADLRVVGFGTRPDKVQWDAEFGTDKFFRRRCWTRTQRRYLTPAANQAARVKEELPTANLARLQELCRELRLWNALPLLRRSRPQFLRNRLRQEIHRRTADVWSTLTALPLQPGDVQLNVPAPARRGGGGGGGRGVRGGGGRGGRERGGAGRWAQAPRQELTLNLNVSNTAQGTLLAVLTEARQPHFSIDNRAQLALQYRLIDTRVHAQGPWLAVPSKASGEAGLSGCVNIWEGQSGAAIQLKMDGAAEDGPIVAMGRLGAREPWAVSFMDKAGPMGVVVGCAVTIQHETKTLLLTRQVQSAAADTAGTATAGVLTGKAQFELHVEMAGFGLSVVDQRSRELLYAALADLRLSQTPVSVVRVRVCRLLNCGGGGLVEHPGLGDGLIIPYCRLTVGAQTHTTALGVTSPTQPGAAEWAAETVSFDQHSGAGAQLLLELFAAPPGEEGEDGERSAPVATGGTLLGSQLLDFAALELQQRGPQEGWFPLRPAHHHQRRSSSSSSSGNGREGETAAAAAAPAAAPLQPGRLYLKLCPAASDCNLEVLELGVRSFQLDNQVPKVDSEGGTDVVLGPKPCIPAHEHLRVFMSRSTSADERSLQLNDMSVDVCPTIVNVEWPFISDLIDFAQHIGQAQAGSAARHSRDRGFDGTARLQQMIEAAGRFDDLAAQFSAAPTKMYVERLRIGTIQVLATTKLKELVQTLDAPTTGSQHQRPLLRALFRVIATVGVSIAEVNNAPIKISPFEFPTHRAQDPFLTAQALTALMVSHFTYQGALCAFALMGANPNFGNPTALLDGVFSGLGALGSGVASGLLDGDVVALGSGFAQLGLSVVGGTTKAVSGVVGGLKGLTDSVGLVGRPVGLLLGTAQTLLNSASDAISGELRPRRQRAPRRFGHGGEMEPYSAARTLGWAILQQLAHPPALLGGSALGHAAQAQIPRSLAEEPVLAAAHGQQQRHCRTIVTATHILQVQPSGKLAEHAITPLQYVTAMRIAPEGLVLRRTHAADYVVRRNSAHGRLDERLAHVEGMQQATVSIHTSSAAETDEIFEQLARLLSAVARARDLSWAHLVAPVLTVTVVAAEGLPKGRHCKVSFELRAPGALEPHYVSAVCEDDVNPVFDECAHFVLRDYTQLRRPPPTAASQQQTKAQTAAGADWALGDTSSALELRIWDRNITSADQHLASAHIGGWLPRLESVARSQLGQQWRTAHCERFELLRPAAPAAAPGAGAGGGGGGGGRPMGWATLSASLHSRAWGWVVDPLAATALRSAASASAQPWSARWGGGWRQLHPLLLLASPCTCGCCRRSTCRCRSTPWTGSSIRTW
eukprot:COSAG01_NODE_386_length_17742_cov_25.176654_2_plen_1539_part_00